MRVLDLFSGLGGWSQPFKDDGHDVTTLDLDPKFGCDITADVRTWRPTKGYDVVLASPPCEHFSTLTFQRGYFKQDADGVPRPVSDQAHLAMELVARTWDLIRIIDPRLVRVGKPASFTSSGDVTDRPFAPRAALGLVLPLRDVCGETDGPIWPLPEGVRAQADLPQPPHEPPSLVLLSGPQRRTAWLT